MNDKELADRVVALGVLQRNEMTHRYYTDEYTFGRSDYKAVRDWRVAGALIEMMLDTDSGLHLTKARFESDVPRAIIEACVEALEESDDDSSEGL